MAKQCRDPRQYDPDWYFSFCKNCADDIVKALRNGTSMPRYINTCDTFTTNHLQDALQVRVCGWYWESLGNNIYHYHWKWSNDARRRILRVIDNVFTDHGWERKNEQYV
jgi:hypothetical protein